MSKWRNNVCRLTSILAALVVVTLLGAPVRAADPITIGFGMALSGPLAANGKMSLLAMKIWHDDDQRQGWFVGAPV